MRKPPITSISSLVSRPYTATTSHATVTSSSVRSRGRESRDCAINVVERDDRRRSTYVTFSSASATAEDHAGGGRRSATDGSSSGHRRRRPVGWTDGRTDRRTANLGGMTPGRNSTGAQTVRHGDRSQLAHSYVRHP